MIGVALERVLEALIDAGSTWKPGAGGYTARCPAHDDGTPSLSVREGDDGRVLLHCHAGCGIDAVAAALGLAMADLFGDQPERERPAARRRIEATYDYTDARGRPLFQKVRYDPKGFNVRRRGSTGSWLWNLNKVIPVLYRLPGVVKAVREGCPVYVVEGEKDADRAVTLGVAATCNFDGAAQEGHQSKWKPAYGDRLRGAHVVVVVDNDDAGYAHGRAVVADLTGKAASVRVVRAAVGGKGADLSDHLDAGLGLDALIEVDLGTLQEVANNAEKPATDREPAMPEPWGSPQPIAKNAKTPLPAFSGREPVALWAMVDAVAASYQVPRDMALLLILAILATSAGGRRRVRVAPDWTEVLALYTVVALPSGEKKSPVLAAVAAPLLAVEEQLRQEAEPGVAVQRALRDLQAAAVEKIKRSGKTDSATIAELDGAVRELEETVVPPVPRLLADDSTPEALARLMAEQGGRLGVLSAEAGLFSILAGRYSSGIPNLDLVLKAWSGDQCRVDRISQDTVIITEPVLSIGLAVQPDLLAGLAEAKHFRGAGLLARFLFALPKSLVGTRKSGDSIPIPEQVSRDYGDAVRALARTVWKTEQTTEIGLNDGAHKILDEFRDELEPRLHPERADLAHIADWANKLPGQLVRVAALLTLFMNPDAADIAETQMGQALDLAPYFTGHALDAFDLMSGRRSPWEPARAVLTWIQRKKLTAFSVRQAQRELAGQAWVTDTEVVREAVVDLEELGWVHPQPPPQPPRRGRPSELYDVNPAAHDESFGNFGNATGGRPT